ncbi:MAG TPA: flagellar motor switch protein FliM [Planctomycetaceae bacterium]|nr:flagellar motor switch protein FliM [Planctomycetaceae bacterium]
MADVLSQSEVESLLAALDPSFQAAAERPAGAARPAAFGNEPVSIYDFKRPERVSKEQMRALHALHEGFSREFGANLSSLMRTIVEVKLISVDQLTYSEFVFSLENPTCFNLLHSAGLEGHVVLDLSPSIVFPILDRLLGGGKEPRRMLPNRPLTEIEKRLCGRVVGLALEGLEHAWSKLCSLRLTVAQFESNPQLVQIVPPNEVVVLISFELTFNEARGILNLCIPFNTIEPLAEKLSSDAWASYTKRVSDPRQRQHLESGLARAGVQVVAELARTTLTAGDLMNLSIGDCIVTEKDARHGLEIYVESRPLFSAFPGLYKNHKAIRIGKALRPPNSPGTS